MELGPNPTEDEVAAWLATLPPEVAWQYRAPPVLMPVPAAEAVSLRGERVVVCDPDRGIWLYEQRAVTEPHDRDGQRVVGVMDETDWYHARDDPTFIVVPRSHPIDQLWVENPQDVGNVSPRRPSQSGIHEGFHVTSFVPDASRPPVRWLRWATDETELTGSRCWLLTPRGPSRGWRACGEPRRHEYPDDVDLSNGLEGLNNLVVGTAIPLCDERQWYRWRRTGKSPDITMSEPNLVWLE